MIGSLGRLMRILVVLVLVVVGAAAPAFAQESNPATPPATPSEPSRAIAFYPEATGLGSFISVEVAPGQSATVNVILGNAGELDQTLRTYSAPARTAVNGGFILADYGTAPDAQTAWLDYPETAHTFAPTEGVSIPVTINVPEDAAPGEYVTGIAAEQAEAFDVPGSDILNQRTRWSIPILITVPGELTPAFELTGVALERRDGIVIASVGIANTGNAIVRPEGDVRLLDADGNVVGVAAVAMESIYTGTATTFIVAWESVPESATYTVATSLTAADGAVTVEQEFPGLVPISENPVATPEATPLTISAELVPLTRDVPPSVLQLNAEISNTADPIDDARVSIVTYQNGVEVDRYPILQAVTINQGVTPVEARYSLPGGFTEGTYTFEVTIELGDSGSQTVLFTQPIDYEIVVP